MYKKSMALKVTASKFIHHWQPTSVRVKCYDCTHSSMCPLCKNITEDQDHIFICREVKVIDVRHKAWTNCLQTLRTKGCTSLNILDKLDQTIRPMIRQPTTTAPNQATQDLINTAIDEQEQTEWKNFLRCFTSNTWL